jgi:hypothetical protein
MLDGVNANHLPEEVKTLVPVVRVREVCDGSSAPDTYQHSLFCHVKTLGNTYGQDIMETSRIPMIMALLTL